ncbi:MAG: hypothetical protein AAFX44_07480 [Pseudomonadota bacterium]
MDAQRVSALIGRCEGQRYLRRWLPILALLVPTAMTAASLEEFGTEMSYFYVAPSAAKFVEFQQQANELEAELTATGSIGDLLVAVMAARIAEKHGWPLEESFFKDAAAAVLDEDTELGQFVRDDDYVNPTKLDIWWGSFFATGEAQYLEKLLRFAGEEMPKDDIFAMSVVGAATWSFRSNCAQHEAVLNFAIETSESDSVSDAKRAFLVETIEYARARADQR